MPRVGNAGRQTLTCAESAAKSVHLGIYSPDQGPSHGRMAASRSPSGRREQARILCTRRMASDPSPLPDCRSCCRCRDFLVFGVLRSSGGLVIELTLGSVVLQLSARRRVPDDASTSPSSYAAASAPARRECARADRCVRVVRIPFDTTHRHLRPDRVALSTQRPCERKNATLGSPGAPAPQRTRQPRVGFDRGLRAVASEGVRTPGRRARPPQTLHRWRALLITFGAQSPVQCDMISGSRSPAAGGIVRRGRAVVAYGARAEGRRLQAATRRRRRRRGDAGATRCSRRVVSRALHCLACDAHATKRTNSRHRCDHTIDYLRRSKSSRRRSAMAGVPFPIDIDTLPFGRQHIEPGP